MTSVAKFLAILTGAIWTGVIFDQMLKSNSQKNRYGTFIVPFNASAVGVSRHFLDLKKYFFYSFFSRDTFFILYFILFFLRKVSGNIGQRLPADVRLLSVFD